MTKIEVAKTAVRWIAGAGAAKIVAGVAANNTSPEKITDKVAIYAGALVLGTMMSDLVGKYTDTKIDELVTWYNVNIKK